MTQLTFTTFKFHKGLNLTIRRGIKLAATIQVGDAVKLVPRDGGSEKEGIIHSIVVKRFRDIRERELKTEHDPQCKTFMSLFNTMKRLYDDFDEMEIVTMIYFTVK